MNPLPATLNEAYQAIHEADAHARAAEVALTVGIAKASGLYEVDDSAVMEAVEGFLNPGGDGTPSVGEFLAHEVGGILQISPDAALEKIGTVREGARVGGSSRWLLGKADDEERTGSCVRGGQRDLGVTGATAVDFAYPRALSPSRTSRACDLDHTIPYRDGETGQTRWGNLAPLARRSHRAKTFGGWVLIQPAPGWFHWRSPAGFEYLVHATGGTIRLTIPEPVVRVEEPPPPWLDPPEPPEDRPVESEAWEWVHYTLC